jgi:hypothetical protein
VGCQGKAGNKDFAKALGEEGGERVASSKNLNEMGIVASSKNLNEIL